MTNFTENETFIDFSMQQDVKKNQKWTFTEVPKTIVLKISFPFGNYISKLTTETLKQRCGICSKLTVKPPKQHQLRRFGGFIVNFGHISYLCSGASIANFEQVNAGWVIFSTKKLVVERLWVAAFSELLKS